MKKKTKATLIALGGLVMLGFIVFEIAQGDIGYTSFKNIGVVAVIAYVVYTFFSKKQKSEI